MGNAQSRGQRAASAVDILIAEDDELNRKVFHHSLECSGFSVRIVHDGAAAIDMCEALLPRLMIMDVSMPGISGYEATRAIRERERHGAARTPIIGVTAHALPDDRDRCLAAGMDAYFSKPVRPNALLRKINDLIGPAE